MPCWRAWTRNPNKPKKQSPLSRMAKGAPKLSPYSDGIDLPFSDEEEQEEENVDKQNFKPLDASITDELKMHEKDLLASHADE